jgi:hypothetical protein
VTFSNVQVTNEVTATTATIGLMLFEDMTANTSKIEVRQDASNSSSLQLGIKNASLFVQDDSRNNFIQLVNTSTSIIVDANSYLIAGPQQMIVQSFTGTGSAAFQLLFGAKDSTELKLGVDYIQHDGGQIRVYRGADLATAVQVLAGNNVSVAEFSTATTTVRTPTLITTTDGVDQMDVSIQPTSISLTNTAYQFGQLAATQVVFSSSDDYTTQKTQVNIQPSAVTFGVVSGNANGGAIQLQAGDDLSNDIEFYGNNNSQIAVWSTGTAEFLVPVQFPSYTIANTATITGVAGQVIAISDSTPGGMLAYWDTTNNCWAYVYDNNAV